MLTSVRFLLGGLLSCLLLSGGGSAHAQDGDYAAKLANQVNACSIVCLDETNLEFFGALVVPLERPSVEYCGVRASLTEGERQKKDSEVRSEVDKEALGKRYSPKEKQALRTKAFEVPKKCDADFKRHCEETRSKFPLPARKDAIEKTRKAIADAGEASRSAQLTKYLTAVLEKCPLEQ